MRPDQVQVERDLVEVLIEAILADRTALSGSARPHLSLSKVVRQIDHRAFERQEQVRHDLTTAMTEVVLLDKLEWVVEGKNWRLPEVLDPHPDLDLDLDHARQVRWSTPESARIVQVAKDLGFAESDAERALKFIRAAEAWFSAEREPASDPGMLRRQRVTARFKPPGRARGNGIATFGMGFNVYGIHSSEEWLPQALLRADRQRLRSAVVAAMPRNAVAAVWAVFEPVVLGARQEAGGWLGDGVDPFAPSRVVGLDELLPTARYQCRFVLVHALEHLRALLIHRYLARTKPPGRLFVARRRLTRGPNIRRSTLFFLSTCGTGARLN